MDDEKPSESSEPISPERPRRQLQLLGHQYSGPLPPPEMLQGFEQVLPGAAERIFSMVEQEQKHVHALQERSLAIDEQNVRGAYRLASRGQILGFVVVFASLLIGALLLYLGKDISGLATILTSLGIVLALFLGYRRQLQHEKPTKPSPDKESPSEEAPRLEQSREQGGLPP